VTGKISHIDAYILAGGKSSRMGTDKGLILFRGKPLIERVIEQLYPLFKSIYIVSNNHDYDRFGLQVIEDTIKEIGPAGGIHASLGNTQSDKIFIVSCDMPFITTNAIQFIIRHSAGSQIALPVYHEQIQPLFGVYSKNCLPNWKRLIQQKIIKLQEMVTHFQLSKINIENETQFNEVLFMNINDENDLIKALQQL